LEHFDLRGGRLSVLRKGKRERQWLSLDPLVTRKLQTWITLRGAAAGPLLLQVGKGGRPHGLRHAAITAALDETNGNVRAAREFSEHASIEVLMRYDDNRKDLGGDVAGKVIRRFAKLFEDDEG
jgi:integrase/recombinase XerC